ncbi:MAG: hypothetical protein NC133_03970 [Prevotella sp.]|nr:hypothetical protein [Prevotella sp.]
MDFLRVQGKKYRSTLVWFVVWLVGGIVFAIITLAVSGVGVDDINYHLIDGNILNAASANASIGSFIWQRILSLALPILVVFVLATLARWTTLAVYPVVLVHGYWLTIAVWWVFFYYSFTALLLLAFYIIWLLLVTALLFAGLLWAVQWGSHCRTERHRQWGSILRGAVIIVGIAVVLGFFEYLVFWTVLGKIVYKPV